MKKRKRTKPTKWQVICDNCYRKQYCQFVLTTDSCLLFRPKENPGPHWDIIVGYK